MTIHSFTFNSFQENTYLVYDDTKECLIIDAGCFFPEEKKELTKFIEQNNLKPVKLINTHCHIDHVFGNKFVAEKYGLNLEMHKADLPILQTTEIVGRNYGMAVEPSPLPAVFLEENDVVVFGKSELKVLHTPGHSPGSISFFSEKNKLVIVGDVLFRQSIGRYDFPGGDYETLMNSIRNKLFLLGDGVKVYSGHGPSTTIGFEKKNNPFLS